MQRITIKYNEEKKKEKLKQYQQQKKHDLMKEVNPIYELSAENDVSNLDSMDDTMAFKFGQHN